MYAFKVVLIMPAKNVKRIVKDGAYCHVYNKGIEAKNIFNDSEDYGVFIEYLKGYLTSPVDPASIKKTFTVNGREFKGTPHQPKNYFNKVELISYSLEPNHFHLLLHQRSSKSIESLIRSLSTRYSIYFNKKYHRSGSLFQGPYKSIVIEKTDHLSLLTKYFHTSSNHSSVDHYINKNDDSWVNTKTFGNDFKHNKKLEDKEKQLIGNITFEDTDSHTKNILDKKTNNDTNALERIVPEDNLASSPLRLPEIFASSALFVLLLYFGINHIQMSKAKPVESKEVLSASATSSPSPTSVPVLKKTIIIKIKNGLNIVAREKPNMSSKEVKQLSGGESYEYVSVNSGWYEIKFNDNSTGFILADYGETWETYN